MTVIDVVMVIDSIVFVMSSAAVDVAVMMMMHDAYLWLEPLQVTRPLPP